MKRILVVLEGKGGGVAAGSLELASAAVDLAHRIGGEAHALLLGGEGEMPDLATLGGTGLPLVRVLRHEALSEYHPDGYARAVEWVVREESPVAVLLPASERGKDVAPRLAARLEVPLAQDVTEFSVSEGRIRLVRPVFAGKALASVRIDAVPLLATLRSSAFSVGSGEDRLTVQEMSYPGDPGEWLPYEVLGFEPTAGDAPDLSEASVVVSGGRGLGDPENWGILEELRAALGSEAGMGATRAVVDAGWRPHAEQVGQTGRTVSPRLYFAIGISGAVQHLAGMRTAGVIVAVNRDPDAPIFKLADYGIVGDALEVVPRLAEELRSLTGDT